MQYFFSDSKTAGLLVTYDEEIKDMITNCNLQFEKQNRMKDLLSLTVLD